jgi:hypothetical protein
MKTLHASHVSEVIKYGRVYRGHPQGPSNGPDKNSINDSEVQACNQYQLKLNLLMYTKRKCAKKARSNST